MPLHHAVLALLADKPAHGYELKSSFEQAVGDQWGGLNIGHLYQILDRLSRDGLIESERQAQQVKPDRVVHLPPPSLSNVLLYLGGAQPGFAVCERDYFVRGKTIVGYGEHGTDPKCNRHAGNLD